MLNLTLGGVIVDQLEELDGGVAGERVFDTLLGRLSDPRGTRKLLAVMNPAGLTSWQYRRLVHEATRDRDVRRVHFTLRDNASNPTAHHMWASDYDGNVVVTGEYYRSRLVSSHAPEILARQGDRGVICWSDPSVWTNHGHANRWGELASIATEYSERGVALTRANNDRAAGYMRVLELLHVDPARVTPSWASVRDGVEGAPWLYVFRSCRQLIAQLKSAPVAVDGVNVGECVDPRWESEHGHAHASLRYGAMSRPTPSPKPVDEPDDWRSLRMAEMLRIASFEQRRERERDFERDCSRGRFVP